MKLNSRVLLSALIIIFPLVAQAKNSMLRIKCDGQDVGAEVTVNGKFKGECPLDVEVVPGKLKIRVQKPIDTSYDRVFEQEIRIGDGVVKPIEAILSTRLNAAGQKLEDQRIEAKKVEADINLGESYYEGKGVAKDYDKAFEILSPLAAKGHAKAQCLLGYMYDYGRGVNQDKAKAFKLYLRAANQGYTDAEFSLGYSYSHGEGIAKDSKKAIAWYQKAAEKQCCGPQINIGLIYRDGNGVPQDYEKALEWFKKSTDASHGQYMLAGMYYEGFGVQQDYSIAMEWYQKAAGYGHSSAMAFIGLMYEYGRGVEKSSSQAEEWYKKAIAKGHTGAQKLLDRLKTSETPN